MTKEEQGRINLFKLISCDQSEVTVSLVTEIFCQIFFSFFDVTETGKEAKAKLTEDEFVRFTTGFVNSFLSTLYANAGRDEKEQLKRMEVVAKVNKDVLVAVKEKREADA